MDNGDRAAFAYPGIWHPAQECFLDNGATGLTKREYFAAMAMQGMTGDNNATVEAVAAWSVQYADALLAELAKEQNNG